MWSAEKSESSAMQLLMKNPFNYTCLLFRKIWYSGNQLLGELLKYLPLRKLSGLMDQVIVSQFWRGLFGTGPGKIKDHIVQVKQQVWFPKLQLAASGQLSLRKIVLKSVGISVEEILFLTFRPTLVNTPR